MKEYFFPLIFTLVCLALINGCAAVTPAVQREEIERITEELETKALAYQINQLVRVNDIGYHLLKALPREAWKGEFPYLGILSMPISKRLRRLYKLQPAQGLVIVGVVNGSPAGKAGLKEGDILLSLNGEKLSGPVRFKRAKKRIVPGRTVKFKIKRGKQIIEKPITMGSIPVRVVFKLVDFQEVNAAATKKSIYLTYGLIRFTESDDEIAVVLSHELAHIVRGHHLRSIGLGIFTDLVAVTLGLTAEAAQPGSGDPVLKSSALAGDIFNTRYSRELEREADYFSLKYAYLAGYNIEVALDIWERFAVEMPRSMIERFLSTHPTSPERLIRIRKAIAEIKEKKTGDN